MASITILFLSSTLPTLIGSNKWVNWGIAPPYMRRSLHKGHIIPVYINPFA
jgi:hypothetical protein